MAAAAFAPSDPILTFASLGGHSRECQNQRTASRLFGVLGIALAMPLVAIGRVAVIRFYVEDYLGDSPGQPFNKRQS